MATTSSTLTASKAMSGQGGNGKGYKGRVAGLAATAALGLGLLAGGLLGHGRQAMTPSAMQSGATAPRVYIALGDRDDPRFGGAAFVPDQPTYREGHYEIYDGTGRGLIGAAPALAPDFREAYHVQLGGTLAAFVPDQFTYREDHRALGAIGTAATHGTGSADEYGQAANSAGIVVANSRALSDGISPGLLELLPGESRALPFVADQFTYREDHRGGPVLASSTERQQFLAWNLDLPTGGTESPISSERQRFLEWNLQLPFSGAASAAPDRFTYREDHRAGTPALVASLMLDPTRCDCWA
jgi:hypothetical protein